MKFIFKNSVTQKYLGKLFGTDELKEYEFKKEIIKTDNINIGLADKVRIIETETKSGQFLKGNSTDKILEVFEEFPERIDINQETEMQNNSLYAFVDGVKWNLKPYRFLFNAPNSVLKDNADLKNSLFNFAFDIVKNTENGLVYNLIMAQPLKDISVTPEKTGEQLRTEIKELYNSLNAKNKKMYLSFNLLSEFEVLSQKLNTPLITDNPLILGGKLLCGVPVEVIENEVLKPYKQKELLICGDLYNSIALIKNKNFAFDLSEEILIDSNKTAFRILQNYDCKKIYDNITVAQITLS